MYVREITPFIRYAFNIRFSPKMRKQTSVTRDCRLFYVVSGKGEVVVNGEKHIFSTGSLMLWQNGTRYRFLCDGLVDLMAINFDYTQKNSDHSFPYTMIYLDNANDKVESVEEPIVFEDCPVLNHPIIIQNCSELLNTVNKLLHEWESRQILFSERCSAILKQLVIDIVRKLSQGYGARSKDVLEIVVRHIMDNYKGDVSNNTLAELVNYHPYYLNRLFLASKGVTLHQYVTNHRIMLAEQQLISTDLTVVEISASVGFSNTMSFTRAFKKKNVISPSEFRRKYYKLI